MNRPTVNLKTDGRPSASPASKPGLVHRLWSRITGGPTPNASVDNSRHAVHIAIIREVTHAILQAQSVRGVVAAVLQNARELVPQCPEATAALFGPGAHELTIFTAGSSSGQNADTELRTVFEPADLGNILEELRHGNICKLDTPQPALFPSDRPACSTPGQIYRFLIPLVSQGELIGTLNLASPGKDAFTKEDQTTAREIADLLSLAFQNAELLEQVRAGRERMQSLSQQLLLAQETERRHIARELHDEIGQGLTAVKINLQGARRSNPSLPIPVQDSVAIVERMLNQVRQISLDLHPSLLDDLGLVAALRWFVDRHAQRTGVDARFVSDPIEPRASPEIETACFRVVQEALTNVARHAKANSVVVKLTRCCDDLPVPGLELTIRDDGVGFNAEETLKQTARGHSLGLVGMRERVMLLGGQLDVQSTPGRGTTVHATLPGSLDPQHRIERRKKRRERSTS